MNLFFRQSQKLLPLTLGHQFKDARHAQGLSLRQAAKKSGLTEDQIFMLESDDFSNKKIVGGSLKDGYRRLLAIQYARSLELPLSELLPVLPEVAPLNPKNIFFLKNYNKIAAKKPFYRRAHRHLYSLPVRISSLFQIGLLLSAIVLLFYAWNFIRHLSRAF